ncbi:MAG: glycoside hydrolase family 26 protein [Streptosporangiaceae bacterium]
MIGRLGRRRRLLAPLASVIAAVAVAGVTAALVEVALPGHGPSAAPVQAPSGPVVVRLPARPASYLGAYVSGSPASYAPMSSLASATGTRPDIALYYSGWGEPFQLTFAREAARHGAVPLIQIEPTGVSLAAIADGRYFSYLTRFADAVAAYGRKTGRGVIIGFAHEPNGHWYPWGYRHVKPATWIAAWRQVVRTFRAAGADNVTWLWTVNITDRRSGIPSPMRWWPGSGYVTWVGIDGYYLKPSWAFAPLFGPTIKAIRTRTLDPILISETAVTRSASEPAQIADLFGGVRAYGLLGLVWFDSDKHRDWLVSGPATVAAFHAGARTFTPGLAGAQP